METSDEYLAREAYEAYAHHTGGKTYDGRQMPTWYALPTAIQDAWKASAGKVRKLVVYFDGIPPPEQTINSD